MSRLRSPRAWIPAAVASLTLTVGLLALQAVSHYAYDDLPSPRTYNATVVQWLGHTYLGFFGPKAFDIHAGRTPLASLAAVGVLLVVGFLGTWWAVRGIAPGSSILPAFLSTWMVIVVTTTLAAVAGFAVLRADLFGTQPVGALLTSALTMGIVFGVKWGWVPALLATIFWLFVRPRAPGVTDPDPGQAASYDDARGNDTRGNDTRGNDTRGNDTRGNDTRATSTMAPVRADDSTQADSGRPVTSDPWRNEETRPIGRVETARTGTEDQPVERTEDQDRAAAEPGPRDTPPG